MDSNGLEPVPEGNFGHPVDGRKGGKRAADCSAGTAVRPVSDGARREKGSGVALLIRIHH